jgi:hypothetical protein
VPSAAQRHSRRSGGLAAAVSRARDALPASAEAVIFAERAGDVCPPTSDPCVVFDTVTIADGAVLDFGTRTLDIRRPASSRRRSGRRRSAAASFTARAPKASRSRRTRPIRRRRRNIRIEARGRCGGDGAACLGDTDCPAVSCEASSGHVQLAGTARVDGAQAGAFKILAAGDVVIGAPITASSSDVDSDGGEVVLSRRRVPSASTQ